MVSFKIAVRTYQRADKLFRMTLRMLRDANLSDYVTVFIGGDIQPYLDIDPELRYVSVRIGGRNAIEDICAYYPRDTPILFLDDDLESFYGGDLKTLVERGFAQSDIFTFGFCKNKYWLRRYAEWAPRYGTIVGGAFAARNRPELITTPEGHCDDLCRTINYLKNGILPYAWAHAGFNTVYAKNAGGMQASGDRSDTLRTCQTLLPLLGDWVTGIVQQPCGLYALKLISPATIKKRLRLLSSHESLTES
jgi:hypothetical protein